MNQEGVYSPVSGLVQGRGMGVWGRHLGVGYMINPEGHPFQLSGTTASGSRALLSEVFSFQILHFTARAFVGEI